MKKNKTISIRLIESAYKDKFKSLFTFAYLITGNERTAESILLKAILQNPMPEERDFEDIFSSVKDMAMKAANPDDSALFGFSGDMSIVTLPLSEWMLTLDEKRVRILVLRYWLDLSVKEICQVTGERAEKVRSVLDRGKARARNDQKGQKSSLAALKAACKEVGATACFPPDFSAVIRSIERIIEDQNAEAQRSFSVKPVLSWLVTGVLMLFIAVIIWMSVVLIDYFRKPVQAVRPLIPVETQSAEPTEG